MHTVLIPGGREKMLSQIALMLAQKLERDWTRLNIVKPDRAFAVALDGALVDAEIIDSLVSQQDTLRDRPCCECMREQQCRTGHE